MINQYLSSSQPPGAESVAFFLHLLVHFRLTMRKVLVVVLFSSYGGGGLTP
jgi:hypothetical protein